MNYEPQHPNHYRIVTWERLVSGDYVNCDTGLARLPKGEEGATHRVEFVVDDEETPFAYCVKTVSLRVSKNDPLYPHN